ncbi:MAG: hypothetical protein DI537_34100 [Stutzerimonas stutzeri]|nr:MAG: hypothetical protein DI537_34100 [Stutzerimonas stutzeri]
MLAQPTPDALSSVPVAPDADDIVQQTVIQAAAESRLLVDAGPGTGKTFAACNRVTHLIRQGVPPSRIWIISFTRTAVHEIRNRLVNALADPSDAIAVRIATLDSHAWSLQSGFSSDAVLTGTFNDNIEQTLARIRTGEELRDYLGERVSHLIVDEAQDIVGIRADLVSALIGALSPDCGVTVFADRAQAIYGFTEEAHVSATAAGTGLLKRLEDLGFRPTALSRVHRTSDPGLLKIFTDVRRQVLDDSRPAAERRPVISREIRRLAARDVGAAADVSLAGLGTDALVLLRRRCDVLMISNMAQDVQHRLRMSGLPARIQPWIGELLWDFSGRHLTRTEFDDRWQRRVHPALDRGDGSAAWNLLLETAGESERSVDIHRLRMVLARANPPSLFTTPEYGDAGPIIGTIHASKGREAGEVHLYLPPDDASDDEEECDLAEEIRVMFVGATRAKSALYVGQSSSRGAGNIDGRVWRSARGNGLQYEVGRIGDLDATGLVGRSGFASASEVLAAQQQLMETPVMTKLFAHSVKELDWKMAVRTAQEKRICVLGKTVSDELYQVARILNKAAAPRYLPFIRSLGLRTVVVAPEDPVLDRLHDPWRSSGIMLAPMLIGFGTTRFRGTTA